MPEGGGRRPYRLLIVDYDEGAEIRSKQYSPYKAKVLFKPVDHLGFDSPTTIDQDIVKGIAGATTPSQQLNVENGGSPTPADYLQAF